MEIKKELVKEHELAMIYDKVCRGRQLFGTIGGHSASFWEFAVSRMNDLDSHRDEPYYVYSIVTEIKQNINPKLPATGVNVSLCRPYRSTTLYALLYYRFRNDEFFAKYIIPVVRDTNIEVCRQCNNISFDNTEKKVKALPECQADLKGNPNSMKEENERLKAENKELKEMITALGISEFDFNSNNDEEIPNKHRAFSQEVQCKVLSLFLSQLNVNFTAHKKAISTFAKQLFGYESDNKCAKYLNSIMQLSPKKAKDCKAINDFLKEIGHEELSLTLKKS